MKKRWNRIKNHVRAIAGSNTRATSSVQQAPTVAPALPSSSIPPIAPQTQTHGDPNPRSTVFEQAIALQLAKIPEAEKESFRRAFKTIDERALLAQVQAYDLAHKEDSFFRPHAERITKTLGLIDRFMGGVTIGLQANPEISAIVVGAIRVVIDLGLKFTTFFTRLTDMICTFQDFLEPLEHYSQAADIALLQQTVANVYANILEFGWKARRVFIGPDGATRRWTSLRAFMRQFWETFESEFTSIKQDFQHHLDVLLHSVQALHYDEFRRAEQARQHESEKKEKSAFLAWVSDIDFEGVHQDYHERKHQHTCDWLTNEVKFKQWFTQPSSALLWCHGKPGIGKTILASHVLEYITAKKSLQVDSAVCFAYYNYRDTRLGDISNVIAALIKQICRKKSAVPYDLLQVKHEALAPSLVGSQEHFISLLENFSEVYIIIDALDECPEEKRQKILGFITAIATAPIQCCTKVFITSRREMDITKAFEDKRVPTIQVQAEKVAADIETFARNQVNRLRLGIHGKTLYVTSDDLKEKIARTLASKAEGMFLWVNLQLDNLCLVSKAQKDRLVEHALGTLPHGLSDTYIRILDRIEKQSSYMRQLALNCLTWTLHSLRPLRTLELQIALAIQPGCDSLNNLELDSLEVILEACGNLVEEVDGAIRPIHYTIQEFLRDRIQGPWEHPFKLSLSGSDVAHWKLATTTLFYVKLLPFSGPADNERYLAKRLDNYQFAHYSCQYFDQHVVQSREVSPDIIKQLDDIFQRRSTYLSAILQIKALRNGSDVTAIHQYFKFMIFPVSAATFIYGTHLYNLSDLRTRWAGDRPPENALHLASSAGLLDAVVHLVKAGCDVNELGSGSTALYLASLEGHRDVVKFLLDSGADIDRLGGRLGTALHAACVRGHEQIVRLLFEKGVCVDAHGGQFGSVLSAACSGGHERIMKMLLGMGTKINVQGRQYYSALCAACSGGHERIVKTLLEMGVPVDKGSWPHKGALLAASAGCHEHIVKLLLMRGANINIHGGAPLRAAIEKGHEPIVRLLLDNGANAELFAESALRTAVGRGHMQVVQLLLDNGADVNMGDRLGKSLLYQATEHSNMSLVNLLLEKGADVNVQAGAFPRPLIAALRNDNESIAKLLLDKGADLPKKHFVDELIFALQVGRVRMAELLLEGTRSVVARSACDEALYEASLRGLNPIVRLLIRKGADINSLMRFENNDNWLDSSVTALYAATSKGHEEMVRLLLDEGADVNILVRDVDFRTHEVSVLFVACLNGHDQIAQMLLDKGANFHWRSEAGKALHAASSRGHERVVKLLLDAGADSQVDGCAGDALWIASRDDQIERVKLSLESNLDDMELALYRASEYGYENIVALLLTYGASSGRPKFWGDALEVASREGHTQVVKLLLKTGVDEMEEALWAAIYYGHKNIVELLLTQCVGSSRPKFWGHALWAGSRGGHAQVVKLLLNDKAGEKAASHIENARRAATENNHGDIVELLLAHRADSNVSGFRVDVLEAASKEGHVQVVRLLLNNNGRMTTAADMERALCAALDQGHENFLKLLLENSKHIQEVDYLRRVQSMACAQERKQIAELLQQTIDTQTLLDQDCLSTQ